MLNQIKNGIKNIKSKMRPPKMGKAGQKGLPEREKTPGKNLATDPTANQDYAHAEGHQKLGVEKLAKNKIHGKSKPMDESAQNNLRPADIIKRNQRPQRRSGPIGRGNK